MSATQLILNDNTVDINGYVYKLSLLGFIVYCFANSK